MKFSILIANYNNGQFFRDCYNSIIQQTYDDWEVIIVDDGSTDNSVEIIHNLIEEDPRFKLYQNPVNKGCGFTKNKCAYKSTGDLLGYLDPDDALYPDALERMINAFRENSKTVVITSKYKMFDEQLNYIGKGEHGEGIPEGQSYLTYGKGALTAFAVFKKDAFLNMGGLDVKMKRAVDQDLYYKLEEQGEHVFLNKFLYKYRLHANGISQDINKLKAKYWHCYAIEQAFKRRKLNNVKIRSISKKVRDDHWSNYYYELLESSNINNKIAQNLYALYNLIKIRPFNNIKFKLKSLIFAIFQKR
ncbi:glycosyltransferase [Gillisia sp. M10.2A]|uniref:Glycosyltransferase n=1 Tax=Gillisia lutea TaxID=2909668 RepID=A0ABS9EGX7_9FLAO|nr:glycosyltransferase family 2 protein [Gillisia lutea]MCF4102116.1 glycosyltransferase [Gillisia lutea]